jgi:hypothetical protein
MRSLPKVLVTIAPAIIVVVFCFFSHAHSEVSISPTPRPLPPVAAPVPTFFESLPDPEPEPYAPPPSRRIQLSLARICVSESGFQVRTNDCTLIYHVLRARSRTGEITMGIMRAYSGRTFDTDRTDNHRWIPHLNHNFTEPRGWRETVTIPWSARRPGFEAVYEHVGELLRIRPENPCNMRVDHWGARGFRRNLHLSNGWRLVECGETLNDFWSLP